MLFVCFHRSRRERTFYLPQFGHDANLILAPFTGARTFLSAAICDPSPDLEAFWKWNIRSGVAADRNVRAPAEFGTTRPMIVRAATYETAGRREVNACRSPRRHLFATALTDVSLVSITQCLPSGG